MGWILETNEAMNRGMEMMGGRVVKRYRMYERLLEAAGAAAPRAPDAASRAPRAGKPVAVTGLTAFAGRESRSRVGGRPGGVARRALRYVLRMPPEDIEIVDAELVLADERPAALEPARRSLPPVAVAAGVAVTGVAAGMATVAVVHRRQARKVARRRKKALGKVVASRSFLLDVHVLGDR